MNAASGTEKATAALAVGLAAAGHRAVIVTAVPPFPGPGLDGIAVEQIDLSISLPCSPEKLREAIDSSAAALQRQLWSLVARYDADTVLLTDALWGLGRLSKDLPDGVRRVLSVDRLPDDRDAAPALSRADAVLVPSPAVLNAAHQRGWDTAAWHAIPHALLHEPPTPRPLSVLRRQQAGDLRILAAVGEASGGVLALLKAARRQPTSKTWELPVRVAAATHILQTGPVGIALLDTCRHQVAGDQVPHMAWSQEVPWHAIPAWLSRAAVLIEPSPPGCLGMAAIEAMAVAVPVISYRTGNMPDLIGPTQRGRSLLAEPHHGPHTLLALARTLLRSPRAYCETAQAAYERSRDFTKDRIAQLFLDAVPLH
ncbi:glycosyltransferase [Streptomyces inhibens]|uniref:glycosyltransferase n=1 Tax=Streptomyces inhibens TaxID=2293571 RepID=UPI00368A352D